jgi:hypothetical protein
VNVGHLQHVALPTEFFLDYAWDTTRWPREKLGEFTQDWAAREFGPAYAARIAEIVSRYTQFNGRRKPELLGPDTFSLVNYSEADRVLAGWEGLATNAEAINQLLPADERDAFFELVLYPVKACGNLNELYVAAAKNHLYAAQGRASANDYAAQVASLFAQDAALSDDYNHTLAGGKWSHMMDQTHIGYTGWQQPRANKMPPVVKLHLPAAASMGIAVEGSTNFWPAAPGPLIMPAFDRFNQPKRYLDIFNRGQTPFNFSAMPGAPWIRLSQSQGRIITEERLWVDLDWPRVPAGATNGTIAISDDAGHSVTVPIPVSNPALPTGDFPGFVEADGYVSMEAEHFTGNAPTSDAHWGKIPGLGRTLSAMSIFPVTAPSALPPKSPCLQYKLFLFHAGQVEVQSILSPTLNFVTGRGLRFALSFDDQPPQEVTAVPADYSVGVGDGNLDWERTVENNARLVKTVLQLDQPGEHTLKFWMVDPGVVLQKLVVNCGGVKPSYLGPPESYHGK